LQRHPQLRRLSASPGPIGVLFDSARLSWELDDAGKAERLPRNLACRLNQEAPGVAASILEGLDEMLTVNHLKLPAATVLTTAFASSNKARLLRASLALGALALSVSTFRPPQLASGWSSPTRRTTLLRCLSASGAPPSAQSISSRTSVSTARASLWSLGQHEDDLWGIASKLFRHGFLLRPGAGLIRRLFPVAHGIIAQVEVRLPGALR